MAIVSTWVPAFSILSILLCVLCASVVQSVSSRRFLKGPVMAETTGETLLNPAMERGFTPSGASPVRDFLRRLWHSRLAGVGIVVVGIVIVAAIFAPQIAP